MEKLIYVLSGPTDQVDGRVERIADVVIPAARSIGGSKMAVLVPDQAQEIRDRCPARIGGDFDSLAAVFECREGHITGVIDEDVDLAKLAHSLVYCRLDFAGRCHVHL